MSVKISGVEKGSYADRAGVTPGSTLLSINGSEIADVLDYRYCIQGKKLSLLLEGACGEYTANIRKSSEFADIGLEFETYLMDKQHSCRNKCIFCFVDQMPKGLRDSLYFKDDDSRLSFFFGNYITLTNLSEREIERIISLHISPVNISVHTMNPQLRVAMMKNPNAGKCLDILRRFYEAGIEMNTQLVLCPGINDGDELRFSLNELAKYAPYVKSIAAVPVGLTKYREGLPELKSYDAKSAAGVIDIIDEFNAHYAYFNSGSVIAFASDEFYLLCGRELPDADYYGEFSQLDNGVGLCALLKSQFEEALNALEPCINDRKVTLATGEAAYELMCELAQKAGSRVSGLDINVIKIRNTFFGERVTVAGLLTGGELKEQLNGVPLGDELLIPRVSLRNEGDRFLDDVTLDELSRALNIKITPVPNDGARLLECFCGGVKING